MAPSWPELALGVAVALGLSPEEDSALPLGVDPEASWMALALSMMALATFLKEGTALAGMASEGFALAGVAGVQVGTGLFLGMLPFLLGAVTSWLWPCSGRCVMLLLLLLLQTPCLAPDPALTEP